MFTRGVVMAVLPAVVCLFLASVSPAQIFYTETFDYLDGDLNAVSGGIWPIHSGGAPEIQVVDGQAVITSPGSADHNRLFGVVAGPTDVLYYAVRFSVELGDGPNINNDYFIHFKDDTTFGYNGRLATAAAASPANDFSLELWTSSQGDGVADWQGDFMFGEVITCVVEFDNATGTSRMWANPVDIDSTNIEQINEGTSCDCGRPIESIALRQDSSNSSVVSVDAFSVGTDFDAVLDAVSPSEGCDFDLGDVNQDGFVSLLDVDPFVTLVTGGAFQCEADINEDGAVTLLDVDPFVTLLTGG